MFGWTERTEQQNHRTPKAFPTGSVHHHLSTAGICPFTIPPFVLQPAQSQLTLQFHRSRGSLVCGSLWVSIYRKTHKHRSHFLSLLLGFLLSQNRPMTPAHDLVSSLAKANFTPSSPPSVSPLTPQGLTSAPHRMEGPVKYK